MRPQVIGIATINDTGAVELHYDFAEIELVQLKIDKLVADFFVEPETEYHIRFEAPEGRIARSISGASKINPLFIGLDSFDVNALLTDMNGHIASFLAREYVKDRAPDQEAAHKEHMAAPLKDSLITVRSNRSMRLDTFEMKLINFYSDVEHPFFKDQLEYALAQLRLTPDHDRRKLFEQYVEGRSIGYRSPEYVKFFKQFFGKHLMQFTYSKHPDELKSAIKEGNLRSVLDLAAEHSFMSDEVIRELVILNELYLEWGNKEFDRAGIISCLGEDGIHVQHMIIRDNMLWDRTAMEVGAELPDDLSLRDAEGNDINPNTLDTGIVYLTITADWCTYCEQETQALKGLAEEYGKYVRFVVLNVDDEAERSDKSNASGIESFFAGHDPLALDKLRIRSIPAFFLIENGILKQSPADSPSKGVAREFHRIRTGAEKNGMIKVWDD